MIFADSKRVAGNSPIWHLSSFFVMAAFAVFGATPVTFTPADAREAYDSAAKFVKDCSPRHAGTLRGHLAANWILDRVSRQGVDAELDRFRAPTPDGEMSFVNVLVELVGTKTNAPWIVLLSHFDTTPAVKGRFQGANDGASTTGLLIALAGALHRAGARADNVALVWTDAEECRYVYAENDGFQGAKRAVSTFREKRRAVKAVIGLDMLGDRDLHVTVPANGTPALQRAAIAAGRKTEVDVTLGRDVVKDDFNVFFEAGCPAIDLIDFSFGPGNRWWHTPDDSLDKISEESLLAAGRLTAELLNLLDH